MMINFANLCKHKKKVKKKEKKVLFVNTEMYFYKI